MEAPHKWFLNNFTAKQRIRDIEKLSYDNEKRIFKTLKPIDETQAPREIRSLIKSINRLIGYFEDRSQHERDFSANASHELRTPLAGIRLQTEIAMVSDDPLVRDKAHANILIALDQSERLIEQLLTLARLTADRVELVKKTFDCGELVSHVVANLLRPAQEKNIHLKVKKQPKAFLRANEESISILLHILIRNAIHYTPCGGTITVKVALSKNKVQLSVTDSGPGIAKEEHERILKRFHKASGSKGSGSGLGLAIAKRICDLHHATLELEEPIVNKGLNISASFPRHQI